MSLEGQIQDEITKFFIREDFIEYWAETFASALKRHTEKTEWLERREIKLDTARDAGEISNIPPFGHESGNYIKVKSLNGEASLRLDTLGSEEFDLSEQSEMRQLFHQLFITNTAQSGKKLVLVLGRGDFEFPESPEKRERKVIIAATTTPLAAGGIYTGAAFDTLNYSRVTLATHSNVASAANGVEVQQSIDGTNWDYTTRNSFVVAVPPVALAVSVELVARWARIRYTNGAAPQTYFRLAALARSMP